MKNLRYEIRWAIIISLFGIGWMYLEKNMGWHDVHIEKHPVLTMLFFIPGVALYTLGMLDKRKHVFKGIMSWKQGFVFGMVTTIITAVISIFSQYYVHTVVTPEFFKNSIAFAVENGRMTQEAAEGFFNLSSYMLMAPMGTLAVGIVTSALVALLVKRS